MKEGYFEGFGGPKNLGEIQRLGRIKLTRITIA
ncbi:hypothetical protein HZF08_02920 [Paenibacillus sp. CGMCC 1.16610]|nr:hypothetical protein [Paenibacillus sp. CGMCC 1.16610]